jgi:hypothetical protein
MDVGSHEVWITYLIAARLFALVFCHLAAQHLVGGVFSDHCSHVCGVAVCFFWR